MYTDMTDGDEAPLAGVNYVTGNATSATSSDEPQAAHGSSHQRCPSERSIWSSHRPARRACP